MDIIDGNKAKFLIEPFCVVVFGIYCAAYPPNRQRGLNDTLQALNEKVRA